MCLMLDQFLLGHSSRVYDISCSFFAKLDMLITTIGIITIGSGILGTTFGIEIKMIIKNFSFH